MIKTNPIIVASFEATVQTGEYDWKDVLLTKVCDENTTIGELVEWAHKHCFQYVLFWWLSRWCRYTAFKQR